MYAGRSELPLSSQASISTTQRACGTLCALQRRERGQRGEGRVAVVGAAAPVEPVAPRTGVHGPRPSRQPVISGCLSRWP